MSAIIDIHTTILVYGDGEVATSNPKRRFVDWSRHMSGVVAGQPSAREYVAQPGETLNIFSGVRALAVDGTTAFDLTQTASRPSVYRLKHSGGTAPGFRTARAYAAAGALHTLTVNNGAVLVMQTANAGYTGVVAGDIAFIPGVATGDTASAFNPNNSGFWVVLQVAGNKVTLRRPVGQEFVGVSETVAAATGDIRFFSTAGVQKGDSLEVAAGFSVVTQKAYVISDVTDQWVEFTSTESLPLETGVLVTAAGLSVYSESKRFVRVEVDQESVVRLNGDTGNSNRLSPRVSGDPEQVAHFEKWGPCWDLKIVNRSTTAPMVVNVISVE